MGNRSIAIYGCKLSCVIFIILMVFNLIFKDLDDPVLTSTGFASNNELENTEKNMHVIHGNSSGEHFDLIINTYMRSGSTFLGKIFSSRTDTLYFFEPLWNAQQFAFYKGKGELCHYLEDRCAKQGSDAVAKDIGKGITLKKSLAFLEGLLDCTFQDHETFLPDRRRFPNEFPDEKHSWNFAKGSSWEPYVDCANLKQSKYKRCFSLLKPVCQGAKYRVMKILRTTLSSLESLLQSRTNLKVIHLFRDPRGIINSHLNTPFFQNRLRTPPEIEKDVKTLCKRVSYDIQIALRFRRLYTDRFRIVQYEDFSNLHHSVRVLYDFMEMDSTPEIEQKLETLIKPDNSRKGFHPYSYSTALPWSVERIADKYCRDVFISLGYPVFKNKHEYTSLRNITNILPYAL